MPKTMKKDRQKTVFFLSKRPKKIRSRQRRRLAEAIGGDYIFEPSENPLGESVEKRKNAGFSPAVNIPIVRLR